MPLEPISPIENGKTSMVYWSFGGLVLIILTMIVLVFIDKLKPAQMKDCLLIVGPLLTGNTAAILSHWGVIGKGKLKDLPPEQDRLRTRGVLFLIAVFHLIIFGLFVARAANLFDFDSLKTMLAVFLSINGAFVTSAISSFFSDSK